MRTTRNSALGLGVLLLLAATISAPLAGQEPAADADAPEPDRAYVETVHVDVINIDVYVTDRDGRPVQGLSRDDFELYVDGRPVAISNFYSVGSTIQSAERGVEGPRTVETPAEEPAPPVIESPPEPPKDQRLHVVVYIDNFNLTPFKRNRVLTELRQFLRQFVTSEDQVMLATYDRSLHLRQPFTGRPENISRALIDIEDISAQGIHMTRERVDTLRRVEDADSVTEAMNYAFDWAGSRRNDISFTIDALREVVDNLAASPGRKAVIYVSEGLPMIAGEDMFYVVQQKFKEEMSLNYLTEFDMSRRFRELANQANTNRVSFYTIDASGLTVLSQGTVDYDIKGAPGERTFFDSVFRSNNQSTLQMLAERTGGRAIINTNRYLPDLERVALDFHNYYSLGYIHPEAGDGRLHNIEVKLPNRGRGWDVRYRDSYRTKSIESKMHDGTLSALHLNLQDNPLEARIEFGRPQPRDDGFYDVPIAIRVPLRNLALLPAGDNRRGDLRIWFAAKDERDKMSDVQELPVKLEFSNEEYEQIKDREYTYALTLMMATGYHDIAIGLLDQLGSLKSFIRRGIPVGRVARTRGD